MPYTVLGTMILSTLKGNLHSNSQIRGIGNKYCLPEDLKFSHPTLEELELSTIVLRPYDVILMLQNLTMHFSERTYRKYPVSVLTSSRTFMEMLEPAMDRLVEITTY